MKIKIYNHSGLIVGVLEDDKLKITHADLKIALRDYDKKEDLIEFLMEKGFKFG